MWAELICLGAPRRRRVQVLRRKLTTSMVWQTAAAVCTTLHQQDGLMTRSARHKIGCGEGCSAADSAYLKQALVAPQVAKAEAEVKEQARRLSETKALQTEAEALRERLRGAQQQCSALEATASLVPGLKSQVSVLTKQVILAVLLGAPRLGFSQGFLHGFACSLEKAHAMHWRRLRKRSTSERIVTTSAPPSTLCKRKSSCTETR